MAVKVKHNPVGTIALPTAGQRVASEDFVKGARNIAVLVRASATVDVTVAGTAVRNQGSVFALFDQIALSEGGRDRHLYDGRMLRFLSEVFSPSPLGATRLAGFGVATTNISEQAVMHFSTPLQVRQLETAFRELDPTKRLDVRARTFAALGAQLVTGGTVAVTNVALEITQIYDPVSQVTPLFVPSYREVTELVTGASSAFSVEIDSTRVLRGIVLAQEADEGERSDIITDVILRSDAGDDIGPLAMPFASLVDLSEAQFGGTVRGNSSKVYLNFMPGGKLSNALNAFGRRNLRFVLGVAANGTNPTVRVGLLELERVSGLVTAELPFSV